MKTQALKGMRDLLPNEQTLRDYIQGKILETYRASGFERISTPMLEDMENLDKSDGGDNLNLIFKVLKRGDKLTAALNSGDPKELSDMGLRYDLTLPLSRFYAANKDKLPHPFKVIQTDRVFRAERPQKGRLRQFHQVGIEWLGAPDPAADAECIIMLMEFYKRLGFDLSKLRLLINSMGDAQCRPAYREQVKQFILDHADEMCDECRERAELNPLRAFDCKNDHCREIMAEAPLMGDNLCDECREHYEQVKRYLDAAGIEYVEDPTLVRGLDYYTRTVFEVEAPGAGVGSIGGGGRYDGLVELEGGKPTAGVGFAVGFERALLALQAFGSDLGADEAPCVYVANAGKELRQNVFAITQELRAAGIVTEADYQGRSLKAQFKQADKVGAKLILVLGGDELAAGKVKVRDMQSHDEVLADLDNVVEAVRERL